MKNILGQTSHSRRHAFSPLFYLVFLITLALGWVGCIFDSKTTKPDAPVDQGVVVDSIYPANSLPTRTVDLYWPIFDPRIGKGKSSSVQAYPPVHVKEKYSGEIVRYRLTRQFFGSWNPELEFKWNYFLLQGNFIFPKSIPDSLGMQYKTQSLYDSIKATDQFTRYVDSSLASAELKSLTSTTRPGAIGISIKVQPNNDSILIQQVIAGSPADRAGIKVGMKILAVNDSSVVGDSALFRFRKFSIGDSGQKVQLTLFGPQGVISLILIREPVAFPSVQTDSLSQQVGYISISGFTSNTTANNSTYTEFRDALVATKNFPMTIIDLRDNGGGSLDIAIKMCDEVLADGTVIIRQIQRGFYENIHASLTREITSTATAGGLGERAPSGTKRKYLLLANKNSASASEIMLVALNEGAGAPIMGTTSYGKGIGQTVMGTPGSGLALVTVLRFTSASGLDYHKHGIAPNYLDSSHSDSTLIHATQKAEELLGQPLVKTSSLSALRGLPGERDVDLNSSAAVKSLRQKAAAIEWNRRQAIQEETVELMSPSTLPVWP